MQVYKLVFWGSIAFSFLLKKCSRCPLNKYYSYLTSALIGTLFDLILWLLQDAPDYAPGTQKNVSGEVIRWNNVSGPEKIDAKKYIELLEAEVEELNRQVGRKSLNGQNELLEYLKSLEPQNLKVMKPYVLLYVISLL